MVGNCTKGCRGNLHNAKEWIESHQLGWNPWQAQKSAQRYV